MVKKTNSGVGFSEIVVKLLFQLGKAIVHLLEVVRVKRVLYTVTIKLDEDFKSIIAVRLRDGVMVNGENIKELMERCIESLGTINALKEEETKVCSVLSMVEGGRNKVGDSIRASTAKSLLYTFSAGLEDLRQKLLAWILISITMYIFNLQFNLVDVVGIKNVNLGQNFIVGSGVDNEGI